MSFVWNPVSAVNLALCVVILIFGVTAYRRSRNAVPLYIGLAFGLFGLSHLAMLIEPKDKALEIVLVAVRTVAYVTVAYALYLEAFKKK